MLCMCLVTFSIDFNEKNSLAILSSAFRFLDHRGTKCIIFENVFIIFYSFSNYFTLFYANFLTNYSIII